MRKPHDRSTHRTSGSHFCNSMSTHNARRSVCDHTVLAQSPFTAKTVINSHCDTQL